MYAINGIGCDGNLEVGGTYGLASRSLNTAIMEAEHILKKAMEENDYTDPRTVTVVRVERLYKITATPVQDIKLSSVSVQGVIDD